MPTSDEADGTDGAELESEFEPQPPTANPANTSADIRVAGAFSIRSLSNGWGLHTIGFAIFPRLTNRRLSRAIRFTIVWVRVGRKSLFEPLRPPENPSRRGDSNP